MQNSLRHTCVHASCFRSTNQSVKFLNYNANGLSQKLDNVNIIQYITSHDSACLTDSLAVTPFESDIFNDY